MKIAYSTEANLKKNDSIVGSHDAVITDPYPTIEIQISCKNLSNFDNDNEINLTCSFLTPNLDSKNKSFSEIDHTEIISNNINPNFEKKFKSYYIFEINQPVRLEIYNSKSQKSSSKKKLIGYCETDIYHIVSSPDQRLTLELQNDEIKGQHGHLVITSKPTKESYYHLQGQIQVNKLKKVATFAKNNPYIVISKEIEKDKEIIIYRSEIQSQCYSCTFKNFSIPFNLLCHDNLDEIITISVYHCSKKGTTKRIGKFSSTIREFKNSTKTHFNLSKIDKRKGEFWFNFLNIVQVPTFSEYTGRGIKMITLIDFSENSRELHLISDDQNSFNHCQKCIHSIGSILTKYDKDQKFPVYGFGAKINDRVSHCFSLNLQTNDPYVNGHQGILDSYKKSINCITHSNPSYLSFAVWEAIQMADRDYQIYGTYFVTVILVTGMISDMQRTLDLINGCSNKPISFIIIGLGDANFDEFSKFNSIENSGKINSQFFHLNQINDFDHLSRKVLADLPKQISKFHSSRGYASQEKYNFY